MSAPDFLDTNVLVYGYDVTDPRKQRAAQALLKQAVAGQAVTSPQVIGEFAVVLLHKLVPPVKPKDLLAILDILGPIKLVAGDVEIVRRAVEAREEYGIHLYDGMIVAAAERAGCQRIWSEDFNAGQKYFGIVVENPFAE